MVRPSKLLASKLLASRLVACALLGVLLVSPTAAQAQSVGDFLHGSSAANPKRGDWQDSYAKQAEQRIDDTAIGSNDTGGSNGSATEQAQSQAQAPEKSPETPAGRVRVQGRDAPLPAIPPPAGLSVDIREQMRRFVQTISSFARRQNRNFMIVTDGALELLIKRDPIDETRFSPARAYMHAIDGVIADGLYFDKKVFGEPTSEARRARKLQLTEIARDNGLRVMVIDYATDRKAIEESYVRNRQHGYISYAAPAPLEEIKSVAPFPPRPIGENPDSIVSLSDVRNFVYIGDSSAFGRMDEYALEMHATNFDLMVTNVFHGRDPLSKRAVDTLKFKQIGARRLVFATVDIGSAASYRYYWKPNWREGSPGFIAAPFRDDPDRYYVQFWRPEWQRLIAGDNQSYIYGVIVQGFDGVVLRGMEETYRFFEGGDEQQQEEEQRQQRMRLQPQATTTPAPGTPAAPQPTASGTPTPTAKP